MLCMLCAGLRYSPSENCVEYCRQAPVLEGRQTPSLLLECKPLVLVEDGHRLGGARIEVESDAEGSLTLLPRSQKGCHDVMSTGTPDRMQECSSM
jgi:hypothetical protein